MENQIQELNKRIADLERTTTLLRSFINRSGSESACLCPEISIETDCKHFYIRDWIHNVVHVRDFRLSVCRDGSYTVEHTVLHAGSNPDIYWFKLIFDRKAEVSKPCCLRQSIGRCEELNFGPTERAFLFLDRADWNNRIGNTSGRFEPVDPIRGSHPLIAEEFDQILSPEWCLFGLLASVDSP